MLQYCRMICIFQHLLSSLWHLNAVALVLFRDGSSEILAALDAIEYAGKLAIYS